MTEDWEKDWRELDLEWQAIDGCGQARSEGNLSTWEADFQILDLDQHALELKGRWHVGPDDLMTIIGRSRHELSHSMVLAWLLNPLAPHGLGDALLRALLEHCHVPYEASVLGRARTRCEVVRANTRADVIVEGGGVTLIVENKVDAGEQPDQCDRLYEHFGREAAPCFVFLTPDGRAPDTASGNAKSAFIPLSYGKLADLLQKTLEAALDSSERPLCGRTTACNYLATLRWEFT